MAGWRIGGALGLGLIGVAVWAAGPPRGREAVLEEGEIRLSSVKPIPVPDRPYVPVDVRDPVFGYLAGLLEKGIYGVVVTEHLEVAERASHRRSSIPFGLVEEVRRAPGRPGGAGWARACFFERLKVPVPYSILSYHPGSLVSSAVVTFQEWHIPRTSVPHPDPAAPGPIRLEDVTLWAVIEGEIIIDIHGWVDAILGGKLDDTYVVGLALFRYQGERLAMAVGFNAEGKGRSGTLDLMTDKIRFPSPPELKAIGRDLRGRVVRHLARQGIPAWIPPGERP